MSESLEGGNDAVVTQNGVTVERQLERRGDGVVVTLELSSDVRGPAEVDLVDEFPPALPVEQAGFNVEHEPDAGEVSLDRVELEHTIEDGPAKVVYAIRLSEGTDEVAFDPPTIRDVTLPGIPESGVPDAAEESNGDDAGDESVDSTASDEQPDETGAERPQTDPSPDVDSSTNADSPSGDGGLPEGLSLDDQDANGDTGAAPSGDDADAIERAIESAIEGAETDGGGLADENGDGGAPADDAVPTGGPATNGSAPAGPGGDEADPEPRSEVPKSVRLRLDRLNARVEEFAAYAEALEGIIERHGTAPEILEEIEADLAEADERLADVRAEVEALESRHAADVEAYDDRLEALEARLDDARQDLESEVDDVRDDVDAVDGVREDVAAVSREVDALGDRLHDHEADVEDLGETVDRVASEVTAVSRNVEAMRAEMETLQDDVDRLLRFREILADVFGGPVRRATEGGADPFEDAGGADPEVDRSGTDGPSSTPSGPSD